MSSVIILTGNHLCHNPRVHKEAAALVTAGFDVEVLGAWVDSALKARDQELLVRTPFHFTPVLDLTQRNSAAKLQKQVCRARNKSGQLAFRFAGVPNRWQLGYAVNALGRVARRRKADLFIAHSEAALLVTRDLLDSGCRVGLDMEDWFSEDLLPEARKYRPVRLLSELERKVLRQGVYATCPSRAMSEALAREYGCPAPAVVYNAFLWSDRKSLDGLLKDRKDRSMLSIHWYSQPLGLGRGLEDLFGALPHLKHEVEIHLRGKPVAGFDDWLASRVPEVWRKRIFVHRLVSNGELLSRIAEHDIGFAGEMKYCRSRDLTVTNKILHYLLGGLAVVASDTAGQREVAAQANGAILLYPSGNAALLAERLNELLGKPDRLGAAKAAALRAAEQTFCWEKCAVPLVQSVERAMC